MGRKKSKLLRELEESIKLARAGKIPKRDSLGNRLRAQDGADVPDSLADPDELEEDFSDDAW